MIRLAYDYMEVLVSEISPGQEKREGAGMKLRRKGPTSLEAIPI